MTQEEFEESVKGHYNELCEILERSTRDLGSVYGIIQRFFGGPIFDSIGGSISSAMTDLAMAQGELEKLRDNKEEREK